MSTFSPFLITPFIRQPLMTELAFAFASLSDDAERGSVTFEPSARINVTCSLGFPNRELDTGTRIPPSNYAGEFFDLVLPRPRGRFALWCVILPSDKGDGVRFTVEGKHISYLATLTVTLGDSPVSHYSYSCDSRTAIVRS